MGRLETFHPRFEALRDDWQLIADAYEGESVVKSKTTRYLPSTSGQRALGLEAKRPGWFLYQSYIGRAVFPEITKATTSALLGTMVREPWSFELPAKLEPLLLAATTRSEPIDALVDRVLESVLLFGRAGILVDVNPETNLPYFVTYGALQIINWDDNPTGPGTARRLELVILDETRPERTAETGFEWQERKQFRGLVLDDGGRYRVLVEKAELAQEEIQPSIQGRMLEQIPFVFVNATDLIPEPGEVPLLGLARLAMTIYRGEADYRQSLFLQGQDTLVITGVSPPSMKSAETLNEEGRASGADTITGTGAVLWLPNPDADAKFIGVNSAGLPEQRQALENDYKRAEQFGLSLLTSGNEAEAADTLLTRVRARTASLASIVRTTARGIEQALKIAAEWAGADPEAVRVAPNLDFIDDPMLPTELLALVRVKLAGMPLSWRTIHEIARKRDLTTRTFEEELEELANDPEVELDDNAGEDDEGDSQNGAGGDGDVE